MEVLIGYSYSVARPHLSYFIANHLLHTEQLLLVI